MPGGQAERGEVAAAVAGQETALSRGSGSPEGCGRQRVVHLLALRDPCLSPAQAPGPLDPWLTSSYLPKLDEPRVGTCRCSLTLILAPIRGPPLPLLAGFPLYPKRASCFPASAGCLRKSIKTLDRFLPLDELSCAVPSCAKLSPCTLVNTDLPSVLTQSNGD